MLKDTVESSFINQYSSNCGQDTADSTFRLKTIPMASTPIPLLPCHPHSLQKAVWFALLAPSEFPKCLNPLAFAFSQVV